MKPILSSFMFSEDTQQMPSTGGVTQTIISPQNMIRPLSIPSSYSFSVTFGVIKVKPNSEHLLQFQLKNPSGSIAADSNEIRLPTSPDSDKNLPPEANGLMMNFNFRNVGLREVGEYKGVVTFDGEVIGEFPLQVYPQGGQ